jgi:hypothetical protein
MAFRRNSPGGCTSCGCGPPPGTGPGDISGCTCQHTPASLAVVVTYGPGEDTHTYDGALVSGTMGWYSSPPAYLAGVPVGGPGYYSDAPWTNDFGFRNYYRLECSANQYQLGLGDDLGGSWSAAGAIFSWSLAPGINTCSPFALTSGAPASGFIFHGQFTISG